MYRICKRCGWVVGDSLDYPNLSNRMKKDESNNICPICKNNLFTTPSDGFNAKSRIEKSLPTWQEVVRHRYLKNVKLDLRWSEKRIKIEDEQKLVTYERLKNTSNVTTKTCVTVKCPYCYSTDTKKITNTSKAIHTMLFGFLSVSRNSKQWHCNKCESDF